MRLNSLFLMLVWLVVDSVPILSRNLAPQLDSLVSIGKIISVRRVEKSDTQSGFNPQQSFFMGRLKSRMEVHKGQKIFLISRQKGNFKEIYGQSFVSDVQSNPLLGTIITGNFQNLEALNRGLKKGNIIAISANSDFRILRKKIKEVRQIQDYRKALQLYEQILIADSTLAEAHYGKLQRMLANQKLDTRLVAKKLREIFRLWQNFYDLAAAKSFFADHYDSLTKQLSRDPQNFEIINERIQSVETSRELFPVDRRFLKHCLIAHWFRIQTVSRISASSTKYGKVKTLRKQKSESIQTMRYLLAHMLEERLYNDESLKIGVEFVLYLHNRLRRDIRVDLQKRNAYRLFLRENIVPRIQSQALSQRILSNVQNVSD